MSEETAQQPTPTRGSAPTSGSAIQSRHFRIGAVFVIALAVGLILWLVLRDNGGSSASANATAVSVDQIKRLAASVGHPFFWVGPKAGYTYELTRTANGSIYIRYLPPGEKVGVKKPYLTVGTYPFPSAFTAIQNVAKRRGVTRIDLAHGGLAVVSKRDPQSVHAAYPGVNYQVEVYDPTLGTATGLVTTGRLSAFGSLKGSAATAAPKAVSPTGLKSLAASLGHPIYWIGAKRGYTYELTRTSQDQVYLRYLPPGVRVGSKGQYLTVGTYLYTRAFGAILALGKRGNAVTLKLPNGGRAVIDRNRPEDIHLAYPGSDYQIEVFDPSPARARQIVSSGQIKSIG